MKAVTQLLGLCRKRLAGQEESILPTLLKILSVCKPPLQIRSQKDLIQHKNNAVQFYSQLGKKYYLAYSLGYFLLENNVHLRKEILCIIRKQLSKADRRENMLQRFTYMTIAQSDFTLCLCVVS